MDLTVAIHISATLFFVSFVMHMQDLKFSDNQYNIHMVDYVPFVVLQASAILFIPVSPLTVFKVALIILQLLYVLHAFYLHTQNTSVQVSIGLIVTILVLLIMRQNWFLSLPLVNSVLLIVSFVVLGSTLLNYKRDPQKMTKELMEIHFFLFIGCFVLTISNSYFVMIAGVILIIVYQLTDITLTTKAYRKDLNSKLTRLNDLEYKFQRVVEFESKKRTSKMVDHVEHIKEKSQRDPLTKTLNRQSTEDAIEQLIKDSDVKIFSIAFFDIDHFKTINDSKGHIVGDEVLKFISATFMSRKRKTDQLGRYGGDEFILILPNVNAPIALEICDRIRQEIDRTSSPKFTISMGIASYPFDGKTVSGLIEIADLGLYKAKENGKNRIDYAGNVPIIH